MLCYIIKYYILVCQSIFVLHYIVSTCLNTCIHAYTQTCIHTELHTYTQIRTSTHPYIRTYVRTYMPCRAVPRRAAQCHATHTIPNYQTYDISFDNPLSQHLLRRTRTGMSRSVAPLDSLEHSAGCIAVTTVLLPTKVTESRRAGAIREVYDYVFASGMWSVEL